MEAYRLYTVVPRLVDMIEQLTNWHIRMNKDRFSGGTGADDQKAALSTLFEVLMVMCRIMAPLTPFFVESQYQNLKKALPPAEQEGSIHFCMMPEVMASAIDATIESDVKVMQNVIVNGRAIRDRHNLSMRTPLPEVTLVHRDAAALAAMKRTEAYVLEELNVRSVKTALVSEVPELVRFKCLPNHTLLGKRFGKDYGKVGKAIKELKHEQLAEFMNTQKLTVDGNDFGPEDIVVSLEYSGDKGERDVSVLEGGLVLLSTKPDPSMLDEATAREVCAKVQKMRKEAGLEKSDEIDVFYSCHVAASAAESMLAKVLVEQRAYVEGRINRPMLPQASMPSLGVPVAREKKDVNVQRLVDGQIAKSNEALTLTLCRACAYFDAKKLAKAIPDAGVREAAQTFVHYKDLTALRASLASNGGKLEFKVDGTQVALKYGEHFFLGSAEAAKAGVL